MIESFYHCSSSGLNWMPAAGLLGVSMGGTTQKMEDWANFIPRKLKAFVSMHHWTALRSKKGALLHSFIHIFASQMTVLAGLWLVGKLNNT